MDAIKGNQMELLQLKNNILRIKHLLYSNNRRLDTTEKISVTVKTATETLHSKACRLKKNEIQ